MSAPTVSVALCTRNGARFVGEQLRSILVQTAPPVEVVVSDDGSTDATLQTVEEVWRERSRPDQRLIVLRNDTPLGVTANFEQAVRACTADLVALSDQDDLWHPGRLECIAAEFARRPDLGLLFHDARLVDAEGRAFGATLFASLEIAAADLSAVRDGDAFGALLRRNLVTGATTVVRRDRLGVALPFDPGWVHDEWMAILLAATGRVDYLADTLIDYRQHGGNQIGVTAPTLRYKIARVLEPRGDRYALLAERALALRDRLTLVGAPAEAVEAAEAKLAHQRLRAALPRVRAARIPAVLREAASGAYRRYSSQGNLDILRDLLQPDRREVHARAPEE